MADTAIASLRKILNGFRALNSKGIYSMNATETDLLRQILTEVQALSLGGTVADGSVTTAKIADANVTTAKIADANVTTAKIADANVTAAKLAATAAIQPTIVNAKGDLIVGTANDTVDRQSVGANGTFLIADSAQTNGIAWSEQSLGYRNVVINGAMQIAQRGTSTAGITSDGYYTADRWQVILSSLGTWTQTVENDAPTGSGFRKSLKILCTTADASPATTDTCIIEQLVEGQNLQQFLKGTASARQLTLSFWVKSNVTGTYIARFSDLDNTRSVSSSYTISASGTWEKKTITFPADTTGAFDNDNAASLRVQWWLGAGSTFTSGTLATTWVSTTNANIAVGQTNLAAATNNYWQVTGVQLEAGSVATPFEFEDYGTTLAKCQRYYYLHASGTNLNVGIGAATLSTEIIVSVSFPVAMRADPTLVAASGSSYYQFYRDGGGSDAFNSFTKAGIGGGLTSAAIFNNTEISSTSGHGGLVYTNNASSRIALNAEL